MCFDEHHFAGKYEQPCNNLMWLCLWFRTFGFLQFVLAAVTLASYQLPLLQASLQRSQPEHIEPSVLSCNKKHKKDIKKNENIKVLLHHIKVAPNLQRLFSHPFYDDGGDVAAFGGD